ncbi:hypothetical protein XH98_35590 [Bradyrhizobium sp. CCBAU 51745]|nr:hypothetical protein [Bradyrhizobium sp. CCBAU 51745]
MISTVNSEAASFRSRRRGLSNVPNILVGYCYAEAEKYGSGHAQWLQERISYTVSSLWENAQRA